MPRKRLPIFRKVSKLLKVSIFLAKMRKPVIPKLFLFRKSQRLRKFKRFGYGVVRECKFSPSKCPLIGYKRREVGERVYSMLFLCKCLGFDGSDFGELPLQIEALPGIDGVVSQPLDLIGCADHEDERHQDNEEGDESIDLRAEKYIERFYEEMRMQRYLSF